MAHDRTDRTSRRMLLTGAVGAAVAAVATSLGRPLGVRGADGEAVIAGEAVETTSETRIHRTTSGPAISGIGSGPGTGIVGSSETGIAVYGVSESGMGVSAYSVEGSAIEAESLSVALRLRRGRFVPEGLSGRATISAGQSTTIVRPTTRISPSSFVLLSPASPMGGRDLWYSLQPDDRTVTIHVGEPLDDDIRVGWFLVG